MRHTRSVSPLFEPMAKRHRSEQAQEDTRGRPTSVQRFNYRQQPLVEYQLGNQFLYDIHEELPHLPANDPLFVNIERLNGQIVDTILDATRSCAGKDEEIDNLLKELQSKQTVNHGRPIRIGIIGDTGTGKSSFINNLLGKELLASEGDGGFSCTQIVQEYHDDRDLEDNYLAEIHFKARKVVYGDIAQHFRHYYRVTFSSAESTSEREDDEGEQEELGAEAQQYFLQLFCTQDGFKDERSLRRTLKDATSEDDKAMLGLLNEAVDRIWTLLGLSQDQTTLSIYANTSTDLHNQLRRFTESKSHDSDALWPLVSIVRTRLNSPFLRQGLIIADCPGLTDTNKERRNGSLRYMSTCTAVIVTGAIDRIIDHSSTHAQINKYVKLKTSSNVFLVITKIDVVNGKPQNLTRSEHERFMLLEQNARDAKIRKNEIQSAHRSATGLEKNDLKELLDLAKENKDKADALIEREKIIVRQANVVRELESQRSKKGKQFKQLRFLPVSNKIHKQYLTGELDDEDMPVLDHTEDGFRCARMALCEKAQEGRLESLKRHCTESMQVSLNRLTLTLEKTPIERKGDVLNIVDKVDIAGSGLTYYKDLQKIFKDHVINAMTFKIGLSWATEACKFVDQWAKNFSNGGTMRAFLMRNGVHKPRNWNHTVDWNQQILSVALDDIQGFLENMRNHIDPLRERMKQDLDLHLVDVRNELRGNESFGGKPMDTFWNQFELHRIKAFQSCDAIFDDICADIEECVQDLGGDGGRHDFNAAMIKLYQACLDPKLFPKRKPHLQQRRYEHIKETIRKGIKFHNAPFPSLIKSFNKHFEAILDIHYPKMCKVLKKPLNDIRKDLGYLFEEQSDTIDGEARQEVRAALKRALKEARKFRAEIDTALLQLNNAEDERRRAKKAKHEEVEDE